MEHLSRLHLHHRPNFVTTPRHVLNQKLPVKLRKRRGKRLNRDVLLIVQADQPKPLVRRKRVRVRLLAPYLDLPVTDDMAMPRATRH